MSIKRAIRSGGRKPREKPCMPGLQPIEISLRRNADSVQADGIHTAVRICGKHMPAFTQKSKPVFIGHASPRDFEANDSSPPESGFFGSTNACGCWQSNVRRSVEKQKGRKDTSKAARRRDATTVLPRCRNPAGAAKLAAQSPGFAVAIIRFALCRKDCGLSAPVQGFLRPNRDACVCFQGGLQQ